MSYNVQAMKDLIAVHNAKLAAEPRTYPFSADEYKGRVARVREEMTRAGIDTLYVTSPEGMCYLHGYTSRWYHGHSPMVWPSVAATIIRADSDVVVHFDSEGERGLLQATSQADELVYVPVYDDYPTTLERLVREMKARGCLPGRVGMEHWSHVPNRAVSEMVQAALEGAGGQVVDASRVLRTVKGIKSPAELAYIEEASRIGDLAVSRVDEVLRPGITELEVWGEMLSVMSKAGGEPSAIHELVRVGSIEEGHAMSSRREIQRGDFVVIDPCGVVNRYHSNIARTYYVGDDAPQAAIELTEIAGEAFDVLCAVAKPGTPVREVNQVLRDFYKDAGIWDLRAWVGGYELGLSFAPDWVGDFVFTVEDEDPAEIFEEGMVTNFESIFHLPVLDTLIFSEAGTRTLSSHTRGLRVIDC